MPDPQYFKENCHFHLLKCNHACFMLFIRRVPEIIGHGKLFVLLVVPIKPRISLCVLYVLPLVIFIKPIHRMRAMTIALDTTYER